MQSVDHSDRGGSWNRACTVRALTYTSLQLSKKIRSVVHQYASTKDNCPDTLDENRRDLRKDIGHWRARYLQLFPRAPPHTSADHPENEVLELPSSYDTNHLESFGLSTLAKFEYEIRLGHAYDAIDDIRTAIHIYNFSSREKQTQLSGQRSGTRAWTVLNSIKNDARDCAKRYRRSYSALLTLGLPKDSELKPIGDQDLWGKDMSLMTKQGDSTRKEPWYWVIGKPRDISSDTWELECTSAPYPEVFQKLTSTK